MYIIIRPFNIFRSVDHTFCLFLQKAISSCPRVDSCCLYIYCPVGAVFIVGFHLPPK